MFIFSIELERKRIYSLKLTLRIKTNDNDDDNDDRLYHRLRLVKKSPALILCELPGLNRYCFHLSSQDP